MTVVRPGRCAPSESSAATGDMSPFEALFVFVAGVVEDELGLLPPFVVPFAAGLAAAAAASSSPSSMDRVLYGPTKPPAFASTTCRG